MKNTKTFRVVMLETEKSRYYLHSGKLHDNHTTMHIPDGKQEPQHFYIVSDEEIQEDDWYISNGQLLKYDGAHQKGKGLKPIGWFGGKVVATTDKSIYDSGTAKGYASKETSGVMYLPSLPESFIRAYIKAFNEKTPITEVQLEMSVYEGVETPRTIKARTDNTAIVHPARTYTREEVVEKIRNFSSWKTREFTSADLNWTKENI